MTHPYFADKAREAFRTAGGDPDHADALAQWAEDAHDIGDPDRGVLVAEDGTLLANTRYSRGRVGATYVEDDDLTKHDLAHREVGMALHALQRQTGQRVMHVKMSSVCRGQGLRGAAK